MQIKTSSLALQSQNKAHSLYVKQERLQVGISQNNTNGTERSQIGLAFAHTEIRESATYSSLQELSKKNQQSSLRDEADKLQAALNSANNAASASSPPDPKNIYDNMSLKDKMSLLLLMALFKKDPELMKALGLDPESLSSSIDQTQAQFTIQPSQMPAAQAISGEYSVKETLYQSEMTTFSAQGQIKTADGKTINLTIDLQMKQETLESSDTLIRLQAATKDPLVINLDGFAAELSDQRFAFDLSSNGTKDLIPMLQGNRAFLALDKNGDGAINNGNELFGAKTGDGFKELRQYDSDKNGWIDENDTAFKQLKLWLNAGGSEQKLLSLKEANIGALYTGSAKTTLHLNEEVTSPKTLGVIQATGLFLKEDGGAGTIQHVDLAI